MSDIKFRLFQLFSYINSHEWFNLSKKHMVHPIGIINEQGPIQSKCYYGHKNGENCVFEKRGSSVHTVYDLDRYIFLVQPILHCKRHFKYGDKCLIYLYNKDQQRLYYDESNKSRDLIYNKLKFWSIASFESTVSDRRSVNKRKHLTHKCLLSFWIDVLHSKSIYIQIFILCVKL